MLGFNEVSTIEYNFAFWYNDSMRRFTFILLINLVLISTVCVEAKRLIFSSEDPEEQNNEFVLDVGNDFDEYSIRFGDDITAALSFDQIADKFSLNRSLDLQGQEIQDVKLERLATAPACGTTDNGRVYFNTTNNDTFVCNGTEWQSLTASASLAVDSAEQTTNYDTLLINSLNILSDTSTNRPADESFVVKTLGNTNLKTQIATNGSSRYFRTFEASVWSSWNAIKTSLYQGYGVQDWDQTDGTASYIGRTRDGDSKWLITLSVPGGFTYAQEENNTGITDFTTAFADRLSLTYGSNFTP